MPRRAKARTKTRTDALPVRPELPREFVAVHKRRRIMDAIAELTAEQGYDSTKIGDIVRRAGVARKTLYDNFEGKEEVFLAAFDAAVDEAIRRIEEACAKLEGGWEEQVQAGLAAFLGYVAEEPALARMCMIEALSATPAATERYEEAVQRFVELTKQHRSPATTSFPRRSKRRWSAASPGSSTSRSAATKRRRPRICCRSCRNSCSRPSSAPPPSTRRPEARAQAPR